MSAKKILVVNTHAPYGTGTARESLDAVLAASAYDQDISLLFLADGVFQLLKRQNTALLGTKSLSSALPVLPMYDVTAIYVQQAALDSRGLGTADLVLEVECLDNQQVSALMEGQDVLLSF